MKKISFCFAVLCMIVLAGCSTPDDGSPPLTLKKDVLNNLKTVEYVKIETTTIGYLNRNIIALARSVAELDFINDKVHITHNTETSENSTEYTYIRDSDTAFHNLNGTWEIESVEKLESQKGLVSLIERLGKVNKMTSIGTELVQWEETYLLSSKMSGNDAAELMESIFRNAIIGTNETLVLKKGETFWWIGKESNMILRETQIVEAEIAGSSVKLTIENNYKDYNVPINIKIPMVVQAD